MSLISLGCYGPECQPINGTRGPEGPEGPQGVQGLPGIDGLNAFGITTAPFTVPAEGQSVAVAVNPAQWATPNQIIYVMGAGYFQVANVSSLLQMTLINIGYWKNLKPGTVVPLGAQVSPAGPQGIPGRDGNKWFNGIGYPVNEPGARFGDMYLDTESGDVFVLEVQC